ncbi:Hypothetical protein I595_954 [Croceitalea dokdonensis DOKDO 023]|uniref:Tetratricopeptide repeat protein n=1 Tax=Croceitalea dokdonensis DOKDO 023 TaxID=1300341 RepID=A0A0P7AL14_9FLAO|nr:hypothetical protein [Croceitalea dokdonensis]KPM32536.1 Hypothetical protein I595_954 [Croceitalea dokdonensis DOKDO 023]
MKSLTLIFLAIIAKTAVAQTSFKPVEKETLDQWITEAREKNEIATQHLPKFRKEHADVLKEPEDANRIFDYGRVLTMLLQPALSTATENPMSKSANKIAEEAEQAYLGAIDLYKNHGRANIMLGLLYNQQGKYTYSEKYLEVGLQLEEGGEDWMVAANQYLLAGAYTYNTDEEKYQAVYKKFKEYAHANIKDGAYYKKMAVLYVSYYER